MSAFRLGVIGKPIAHSQSPKLHQGFAKTCDIQLVYDKYLVESEHLGLFIKDFFKHVDAKGLNITLPYKQDVIAICDQLSTAAQAAGAVNTLIKDSQGRIVGDNTDGVGLIQDLCDHKMLSKNSRILIIGAGGAAKGIVSALKKQLFCDISIINRTQKNAELLASQFSIKAIMPSSIEESGKDFFDLIINTASSGGKKLIEHYQINPQGAKVYDISYGERAEQFLVAMRQLGAIQALDGTGMLINQAAYAFKAWFGVMPETSSAKLLLAS